MEDTNISNVFLTDSEEERIKAFNTRFSQYVSEQENSRKKTADEKQ